ncbi:MAG TPA: hypothetical protein VKA46_30935 [Gemmataceae bacterium]|nr:hypothetical protein [Gemmataceae bacterium]
MRPAWWLLLLGLGVLAGAPAAGRAEDKKDSKGTVVEIDGLSSKTPADWKEETPSSNLRYAQFSLPKVKEDKQDAELVIFKGIPDTVKGNIERWQKDFLPPKGKKAEDISKVSEVKLGDKDATYVDVQGTYLFKKRPRDPNEKPEERPDYRLIGVIYDGKTKYQIRLVGPAATVEHYKKGFDEWVKNFK